ncbi:ribonuclease Oy [Anopheles nili]|uniref:ribonuclease Oy n=1 Tax=Anopheles nili TaxID=185578 RepID=UPI00237A878E|nr:ribonuclease Oy [Anopheles nili]
MTLAQSVITLFAIIFLHSCVAVPNSLPFEYEENARENAIIDSSAVDQLPQFDLLIFTQRWPITACYEWRETSQSHICGLPTPATVWSIHGIWPTKRNTIGPAFCDKTAVFNVSQLSEIETQLEQHWVNVEKNKPFDSLWEHEWLKHGTCAAEVIEELNTERKYFGQGLSWLEQHSVDKAFTASGGIQPGYNYSLSTLNKALYDYYGKHSAIECYFDRKTHSQLLNEVRICFDKQLQLADCDGIVGFERVSLPNMRVGTVISNCNAAKSIFYPATVPSNPQPIVHYEAIYETGGGDDGQEKIEFVEVIMV